MAENNWVDPGAAGHVGVGPWVPGHEPAFMAEPYPLERQAHAPGWDLRSIFEKTIESGTMETLFTGRTLTPPRNHIALIVPNWNASWDERLIMPPFAVTRMDTGDVRIPLYNTKDQPHTILRGDTIAQAFFVPVYTHDVLPTLSNNAHAQSLEAQQQAEGPPPRLRVWAPRPPPHLRGPPPFLFL